MDKFYTQLDQIHLDMYLLGIFHKIFYHYAVLFQEHNYYMIDMMYFQLYYSYPVQEDKMDTQHN